MRIFVTGGTGFLGKYVVNELHKKGHHVLVLSRTSHRQPGVEFLKGDMSDVSKWKKKLKLFKPDSAIHLAWEGLPSQAIDVSMKNIFGGMECIRALGEAGCKTIVVAGSDQEYGHSGKKMKEDSLVKPYNLLFSSKVALYWLGSKLAEQYKMNFVWARIFFLYGAGQRPGALIPYLTTSLYGGAEPEIRNPHGANDFVYVQDAAEALVLLATKKAKASNAIYNIASGVLTPTATIISHVYASFKKKPPRFSKNPNGPATWVGAYADISKIKKDFGWKPKVGLEAGIKKTVKEIIAS